MAFDVHAGDESGRIEVAAKLEVVVAGMELAMEAPLREIVANADEEPSVVLNAVKEGKGNFGYNAQTGEYGDMIEFGILDPTKVTRTELRAACARAHTAVRPGAGALPGFHCAR